MSPRCERNGGRGSERCSVISSRNNVPPMTCSKQPGFCRKVPVNAPFDFEQKKMGADDFTQIPNGIPSVEDRVNLLYTHGVATGRIDMNTFVDAASTQAAKLFSLYPRKGAIQIGSDADLVIYDPNYTGTISAKTQQMNVDYSAFDGWEIAGRPETVMVRGEIQVRDGQFVGTKGHGKFLERQPNHF